MAQYARPESDISAGSWVTTPLYAKLDEASYDDGDYIEASVGPTTSEIGMSDVSDPVSSSGHVMRIRAKYAVFAPLSFAVALYQGATTRIALNSIALTSSFAEYTYNLTAPEADAITDYTDLRLQFIVTKRLTGGGVIQVSWAEFECPDAAAGSTYEAAIILDRAHAVADDTPDFYFAFPRSAGIAVACEAVAGAACTLGRVNTASEGGGVVTDDDISLDRVLTDAWLSGYMPSGYTALVDLTLQARIFTLTIPAATRPSVITIGNRSTAITVEDRSQDLTIEAR